ncbi:MAG: hypothetical protein LBV74_12985 [Tannerella sp.]|jgi:hypothetical protein|nr:hypothetical protein [Tannerella sp.]
MKQQLQLLFLILCLNVTGIVFMPAAAGPGSGNIVNEESALFPVTFEVVGENGTLTAELENGTPIVSGTKVAKDETVIFKATPNSGYRLREWKINGSESFVIALDIKIEIDEPIHVSAEFEPVRDKLTEIVVTKMPDKTVYEKGDALDLTGMEVTAYYIDETNEPITNYTTSPRHGDELTYIGTNNILVRYSNGETMKHVYITITVKAPVVAVSDITGIPTIMVAGEDIDLYELLEHSTGYQYMSKLWTTSPAGADDRRVEWVVTDAGITGANLEYTTAAPYEGVNITKCKLNAGVVAGDFVLTATVAEGLAPGQDYTKDFTITVTPVNNPAYGLSIGTFTGGSVAADKALYEENELVTLTIQPANGYELDAITAYRTGIQTTLVILSGTGNTRTFEMPDYDVTVRATFSKTQGQLDKEAVEEAVTAIEGGAYRVAQATANDAESVRTWLINTFNALFGQSYDIEFRSATSIVGNVVIKAVTPAIEGTENNPSGTNGNFTFTVTSAKGAAMLTTAEIHGIIAATPFVSEKSLEMLLLDDLKVRIINTGNVSTGDLVLALSGRNAEAFVLPSTTLNSLRVGNVTEIAIKPSEGLDTGTYMAALTVSGYDILPVTLEITYKVTTTGIDDLPQTKAMKVWVQNGQLHMSGLTINKPWSVYHISGVLVHQGIAGSDETDISLPTRGVYIVISGNSRFKVAY